MPVAGASEEMATSHRQTLDLQIKVEICSIKTKTINIILSYDVLDFTII